MTTTIPMKGGDEMTLVQPEGVPTPNRAVVSRDTGAVVGRRPEPMTGPTAQAGCRSKSHKLSLRSLQTSQGGCQGRLIVTPATAATPSEAAHDGPDAALTERVTSGANPEPQQRDIGPDVS